jgi:hypothetical protein
MLQASRSGSNSRSGTPLVLVNHFDPSAGIGNDGFGGKR